LASILLLGIGLRLSLKTQVVQKFVKNKVVQIANNQLNATLNIGAIEGDLWNSIQLNNVLVSNPDTLISIDSISVNYEIMSLLSDVFQINKLSITGTHSTITEVDSSQFNLQQILIEDTADSSSSSFYFNLQELLVSNFNSKIISPTYLPDGLLKVQNLNLNGSFTLQESMSGSVSDLNFLIKEGRLPEAIQVNTSATFENETITLQQLVIDTGRSLLNAHASSDLDLNQIQGEARFSPLSLADIEPYLDATLPPETVEMKLTVGGNKESLDLGLSLKSESIKNVELAANLDISAEPKLKSFTASGEGININDVTNSAIGANMGAFKISIDGNISTNYEQSSFKWNLSADNIRYEDYLVDHVEGSGNLANQLLTGRININSRKGGALSIQPTIAELFSDLPEWNVLLTANNIDLSVWAQNPDMVSNINFVAKADGKGFTLSDNIWNYEINTGDKPVSIMNQIVSSFQADGVLSEEAATIKGSTKLIESLLTFDISASQILTQSPAFEYTLATHDFDISDIVGFENFPTLLNTKLQGSGSGNDFDNLVMNGLLKADSSYINRSILENIKADFNLENRIITIKDGLLLSDIADGDFTIRNNLFNSTDPNNNLVVDLTLKELQPLAPLLGLEILQAKGKLQGEFFQNDDKLLQCDATLNLEDIQIDEIAFAETLSGEASGIFSATQSFDLNLSVTKPLLFGTTLQDINLISKGSVESDSLYGNYELSIIGSERGQIQQNGTYGANLDLQNYSLSLNHFDIIALTKKLELQKPFHITVNSGTVRTDTLSLASKDGAFLTLSIPFADNVRQEGWLKGNDFDFGLIQDVLLDERFVDGALSGDLMFERTHLDLKTVGAITLQRLNYEGFEADSLTLNYELVDERLVARGVVIMGQEKLIEGDLNVPFVLASSTELPASFYEQPVDGNLKINPTELSRFQLLLNTFNITNTSGIVSFDGTLSGFAGKPNMDGALQLSKPVLSGITVDSTSASFSYNQSSNKLLVSALVLATKQKAISAEIEVPFIYNFQNFEFTMPDDADLISAVITTKDFNLAVFNDFLNKTYTKNLKGTLNGDLRVKGSIGEFDVSGYMDLTRAELEVPIANIKLAGLRSSLTFDKNGIKVNELYVKSGKGDLKASGRVSMTGLIPDSVDIKAVASQFKLINTQDYNLTIDLDSRLSGNAPTPKLTGKLAIKNGFIFLADFGDKYIEEVQLEGESESFSPYDSLAIDMQFVIERNFFVRNKGYLDMDIELRGNLDALKETNGELSLFGTLDGVKGYVKPLGKIFNLDEAQLTFSGPMADPDVYVKSSHKPNQSPVIIYYIIDGNASDPDYIFDSDPPMEQKDIIAYTLFGRPFYALDSWQRTVSGGNSNSASDILVDILLDEVESLATRELGIDVVQIDNIRSGTESGTSIKTGWYINQRTFFAIVNEFTTANPKTLFLLEYMLTKDLDLIITQGDNSRQGIDLRWTKDY